MDANGMRFRRRLTDVLKVLAVFALVGPPVGAMTFFAGIGVYGAIQTGDIASLMWVFLFGLIYAVPLSYFVGIIPAAISGLILGSLAVFHRVPGLAVSAIVGIFVGLGVVYSGAEPTLPHTVDSAAEYAPSFLLIVTCLVATVACWALAKYTLSRTSSSPSPGASESVNDKG